MSTRPIAALDLPDLAPGTIPTGQPELTWIDPRELRVDERYQRDLSDKGVRLIRRIVEGFDWRRFKPPTCVWTEAGLEVIDGQHSAIAAATHPEVAQIPVVVVDAAEVATRAEAFVGLNRDRLAISAMELHAAAVVAGDPAAVAIDRVCQACGVTVLRHPRAGGVSQPRDLVAVKAVGDLVRRVGEPLAIEVVRVLAEAELAPITAPALRAVEVLLLNEQYADQVDPARLTRAIVALGPARDKEAGVFGATHRDPRWPGLVAVRLHAAKRVKPAAQAEAETALPARRVILHRTNGAHDFGDPSPGRSALDRQRAGG